MMEAILNLDGAILLWLQNHVRNDILTWIFILITRLGDQGRIWIAIILILLLSKNTRKIGIMSAIAIIFATTFNNVILKGIFERTRPYEVVTGLNCVIENMKSFSFPSGHTSSSFAMGTILYTQLPRKYGIPALILAGLIAFSRMYLGVHYPTDIIGGMLTGIVSALIVIFVYKKLKKKA